jgi:alpha-amylase/alpha-mannosidase (GH57 family)
VDNAIKVANNFHRTKNNMEKEISKLKEKLNEKNDKNYKENFERIKFNEGSYWMSKEYLMISYEGC